MAILYGTQSNGETLPVLVDQFGNLLAKGINGQPGTPGTPGTPGEPGPPGGSFPLPPDPYEGALLGWLDNGLAWIGTPPVPIPENVFGPITSWDPFGMLVVEGEIPSAIAQGVFVYQCNQDGTIYVEGWNNSHIWSDYDSLPGGWRSTNPITNAFNGDDSDMAIGISPGQTALLDFTGLGLSGNLRVNLGGIGGSEAYVIVNGDNGSKQPYPAATGFVEFTGVGTINTIQLQAVTGALSVNLISIAVNGSSLVDSGDYPSAPNLNFRVQSVSNQSLIGSANRTEDFSIGKYLCVPEQSVARWLYDGNLNKVITSTGIDISRLTGN